MTVYFQIICGTCGRKFKNDKFCAHHINTHPLKPIKVRKPAIFCEVEGRMRQQDFTLNLHQSHVAHLIQQGQKPVIDVVNMKLLRGNFNSYN